MKAPISLESATLTSRPFGDHQIDILTSSGLAISIGGRHKHYAPLFANSLRTANALAALLDCCELNLDDMEEDTRRAIEEAKDALIASSFIHGQPEGCAVGS